MNTPKTFEELEASLVTPNVSEDALNRLHNLRYSNTNIDLRDVVTDETQDDNSGH